MDHIHMGPNWMTLRMLFVIFFIAFPVVVTVTLLYRNSSFGLFEGFSESSKVERERNKTADVTSELGPNVKTHAFQLGGSVQNITHHDSLEGNNDSLSSWPLKDMQWISLNDTATRGTNKNATPEDGGSKSASLTSSKNDSIANVNLDDKLLGGLLTSGFDEASCIRNQMISMVATFLYAILTDRVLLVKFEKDKHNLFCEPFLNSTWVLPEKSPFWNEKHIETYQILLKKDRSGNSTENLPSILFINLQHTRNDPEKFFHCVHSQDLLQKIPLLILQSDQYFVPSLFINLFFDKEITKMFPEKDLVFYHLGRYLFHPLNEAWEQISNYYQAHLAKADERIGLQIRHNILPKVDHLQSSASSTGKNHSVKAVLVASLHQEYGDNLRSMYVNKSTVSGEIIKVYQPSHEGHQKFNDNKHNMKAWMDMYLLSLSDVLVTTSLSTFGYVAQGLGNLKPWLLYRLTNNDTHIPSCQRDLSSEPCYHIPPKHYCNGDPVKSFLPSFPYLRECKDYWIGMKLVNDSI
ncbi:hypothetical protein VNO78_24556 [Psophocarpus tetragonolobus]|uniref:Fucosyltransferase n=1 Tax=Psophocarpus tetragonolobus TaxID=3891 RepID=A0AAN9XEM4_PSOTE